MVLVGLPIFHHNLVYTFFNKCKKKIKKEEEKIIKVKDSGVLQKVPNQAFLCQNLHLTFTFNRQRLFRIHIWEGVSNLGNLHTNLAGCNIGQGSLTPLKYRIQSWVQIFIAVQI